MYGFQSDFVSRFWTLKTACNPDDDESGFRRFPDFGVFQISVAWILAFQCSVEIRTCPNFGTFQMESTMYLKSGQIRQKSYIVLFLNALAFV